MNPETSYQDALEVPCPSCGAFDLRRQAPDQVDVIEQALEPYGIRCGSCSQKETIFSLVLEFVRSKRYQEALKALVTKMSLAYFALKSDSPIWEKLWVLDEPDQSSKDVFQISAKAGLADWDILILFHTEFNRRRPDWWMFSNYEEKGERRYLLGDTTKAFKVFIMYKAWLLQAWLLRKVGKKDEASSIIRVLFGGMFLEQGWYRTPTPSYFPADSFPYSILFRFLGLSYLEEGREPAGFAWLQIASEDRFNVYEEMCLRGAWTKEIASSRDLLAQSGAVELLFREAELRRFEVLKKF